MAWRPADGMSLPEQMLTYWRMYAALGGDELTNAIQIA